MRRKLVAPSLLALAFVVQGCAHAPVSSELPLRRVAIYRNGVGYFERAGKVSSSRLHFKVQPDHLGDFLATLAVMEQGGSSVRSASFPLHLSDKPSSSMETVVLDLDGEEHHLAVGYIAKQPVWKPSYRLVFGEGNAPYFQAWGIVQNLSGEDWKDVSLSLVAGAPISFESTLGTPVTPERPVVTDNGEVITSVPQGESSLALAEAPPAPPAALSAPSPMRKRMDARSPAKEMDAEELEDDESEKSYGGRGGAPTAAPKPTSVPRNLAFLAAGKVEAGTTRYDLPTRITVPDQSATMVLLVSQPVKGESVFMFAPEPGIPDSARHPLRVARFVNSTPGLLERGPIAVFESGAFLGEGLIETLAAGGEATVPFALERGLAVDSDRRTDQQDARLAKIEAGNLTLERDQVLRTLYRLQNGGAESAKVVVKHPRTEGMRLHTPPAGTEDQVGKGNALVPVTVAARGKAELKVEERRAYSTRADWFGPEADLAVKTYLADSRADAKVKAALEKAWELRLKVVKNGEALAKLQSENAILENASAQTRDSLKAISRNQDGVTALRKRLTSRLAELEEQLASVNKRVVELNLTVNEQRVLFSELVREIRLTEPLAPAQT